MPYAILRIGKLASVSAATSATEHNYRLQDTPNADPQLADANVEYLNHERRNYWQLAGERIDELHLPRLRSDAVRAVELVLTASPDAFPRGADHRAHDVRNSPWLRDNLAFVQQRFGKENVVGFTLHQDEITPHIHCVVVPVTATGRLSCRDVFSPASLRQLQTDYAEAMKPHGLTRGIQYSTARHEDVRRHYGAQQMSQHELRDLTQPLRVPAHRLHPRHESLTETDHKEFEQMRLGKAWDHLLAAANNRITQLATVATANALAHERAKVLERQLANSQELLAKKSAELTTTAASLAQQRERADALERSYLIALVRHSQGRPLPEAQQQQVAQRQAHHQQILEQTLAQRLRLPLTSVDDLKPSLAAAGQGYQLRVPAPKQLQIRSKYDGMVFNDTDLRPNGRPFREQYLEVRQQTKQRDCSTPSRDSDGIEL